MAKKQCTNSACRKYFTIDEDVFFGMCPHCGKVYPRLMTEEGARRFPLVLCRVEGSKTSAAKVLVEICGISPKTARKFVNAVNSYWQDYPLALKQGVNFAEAYNKLTSCGAVVRLSVPERFGGFMINRYYDRIKIRRYRREAEMNSRRKARLYRLRCKRMRDARILAARLRSRL